MTTSDARNHKRRVNRHVDEKMAHYRMSVAFASAVAILEAAADGLEPPPRLHRPSKMLRRGRHSIKHMPRRGRR